jgi:hypothetical protein
MVKEFVIRFCTKVVFKLVGHFQVGNEGGCHFGLKGFCQAGLDDCRQVAYVCCCLPGFEVRDKPLDNFFLCIRRLLSGWFRMLLSVWLKSLFIERLV